MSDESPPVEPPPKEDFRQKQLHELEQLQRTLDENTIIRQKFNALQTQVAPLVDSFAPAPVTTYQSERVYTPEEIEAMKLKLEQTLADYREETSIAGRLNSEMEKRYSELSNMRMKFRLDQDDRLTRQNFMAGVVLASFRVKSVKLSDTTAFERERLAKAVGYLQHIFDSSTQDIKDFELQSRINNRGIQELSATITITREDIRDFTDQLQKIQPRLREYELLRQEHQESEELVVKLGDEFDSLRKQVETESLTASIRREIEGGNRTIADLNRTIDQILNKTSKAQEKIAEAKGRIASLEAKIARTLAETGVLQRSKPALIEAKDQLRRDLNRCQIAQETVGGENELLAREIRDGLEYGQQPWQIRKELLKLKGEVKTLGEIEDQESNFESILARPTVPIPPLPPKKRLRLIPLDSQVSST
jgi:uncharacterized phage infection (PIP) family protein YhgE